MYEQFWNLNCNPFDNDADPEFFYPGQTHQAALLKMRYVVEHRQGAGILVGGSGYGKTYLAHRLAHELGEVAGPFAHVVFPRMTPPELLAYLAVELGAESAATGEGQSGLDRTVRQLEWQLARHTEQGRHPVIIFDEAHLAEDERFLQTIHLLLNFRRPPKCDFSVILLGERMLLGQVQRVVPLDERIAIKSLLAPLSQDETAAYVRHRLETAGAERPIFDPGALETLFELSGGVPRKINRLCDLGLLVGFADEMDGLSAGDVEAVSEELTAVVPD